MPAKKWYPELIEAEIRKFMAEHNMECMPPNLVLVKHNQYGLSNAIQKNGGFLFWANKLGIKHVSRGNISWTKKLVEQEIQEAVKMLGINRMPTSSELKQIGRSKLANVISRSDEKYEGWAKKLDLPMKDSETRTGIFFEKHVMDKLSSLGYEVSMTPANYPFDLFVNSSVKIDVKAGKTTFVNGFQATTFGINKKMQTCDIYILVRINEDDTIGSTFIVPSHLLNSSTVTMGKQSKYDIFVDQWRYIDMYTKFFESVTATR